MDGPGYSATHVFLDGPPPIGRVSIPLLPGLACLYGLNGVGKSKVVAAVRDVLLGQFPAGARSAGIALCIDEQTDPQPKGFSAEAARVAAQSLLIAEARNELDGSWPDEPLDPDSHERRSFSLLAAQLFAALFGDDDLPETVRRDIASGVQCGYVLLEPAKAGRVGWTVWAAAPLGGDDDNPTLTLYREEVRRHTETLNDLFDNLAGDGEPSGHANRSLGLFPQLLRDTGIGEDGWYPLEPLTDLAAVFEVGFVEAPALDLFELDVPVDVDGETRRVIFGNAPSGARVPSWIHVSRKPVVTAVIDDEIEFDETVLEATAALSRSATDNARLLLERAPDLRFVLGHPNEWARGVPPRWQALDQPTEAWVDLDQLSTGQRRWAMLAVRLALRADQSVAPLVVVGDEPEAALHRRAEAHLADGLAALAADYNACALMASHSPTLIAHPSSKAWHCERDHAGLLSVATLQTPLSSWLELDRTAHVLGTSISDLLALVRVFVVVEGLHDEIVVERLLGTELAQAHAHLVRLDGAKRLDILTASELLAFSDAHVLVVLDGIGKKGAALWRRAAAAAHKGDDRVATRALNDLDRLGGGETRWLADLGHRTLSNRRITRITVHGFEAPDIVCYLPVDEFISSESDWAPLLDAWRADQATDLKGWLKEKYNASFSKSTILRAAGALTSVPSEITELGHAIRAAAVDTTTTRT